MVPRVSNKNKTEKSSYGQNRGRSRKYNTSFVSSIHFYRQETYPRDVTISFFNIINFCSRKNWILSNKIIFAKISEERNSGCERASKEFLDYHWWLRAPTGSGKPILGGFGHRAAHLSKEIQYFVKGNSNSSVLQLNDPKTRTFTALWPCLAAR